MMQSAPMKNLVTAANTADPLLRATTMTHLQAMPLRHCLPQSSLSNQRCEQETLRTSARHVSRLQNKVKRSVKLLVICSPVHLGV